MKGTISVLPQNSLATELEPLGLSGSEDLLLFLLLHREQPGLRQEELAEQLDVDKAAISRTVKSLGGKGLCAAH